MTIIPQLIQDHNSTVGPNPAPEPVDRSFPPLCKFPAARHKAYSDTEHASRTLSVPSTDSRWRTERAWTEDPHNMTPRVITAMNLFYAPKWIKWFEFPVSTLFCFRKFKFFRMFQTCQKYFPGLCHHHHGYLSLLWFVQVHKLPN